MLQRKTFKRVVLLLALIFNALLIYFIFNKYYPGYNSDVALRVAAINFSNLSRVDTLNLGKLFPFAWDTVYVFEGYTSEIELSRELPRINWAKVMHKEEQVPYDAIRFIFIKEGNAIAYWDVHQSIISDIHFKKYFIENNFYKTSFTDYSGQYHRYGTNFFTRQQAKFILVKMGIDDECGFCTMQHFLKIRGAHLPLVGPFYMHPISGCGFPDCMANK